MTETTQKLVAKTVLGVGIVVILIALVLFYIAILFGDGTAGGAGGLTIGIGVVLCFVAGIWLDVLYG